MQPVASTGRKSAFINKKYMRNENKNLFDTKENAL